MKSLKFMFYALVGVVTIFPMITFAQNITNLNGIVISEEEYNNFRKVHSHEYILTMDRQKYEKLVGLNYDNVITETKYVATTYNRSLNLTTERELTKEEYDTFNNKNSNSRLADDAMSYETAAKQIVMSLVGGTTWNYVTLTATWKYIPNVRSFDVIGFRGYGFEIREGSQNGEQIYILDGNYTVIDYAWDGTNTKRLDEGYGISMNIVNSDISFLQLEAECDIKALIDHPTIYSSYQHAVSSVSLANSQNFTLGIAGFGAVFVWPYSIAQKYDGMSGLRLEY